MTAPQDSAPRKADPRRGMLPGMAAICMVLLLESMYTGFQMLRAGQMPAAARYSVLAVCSLVVVGVFGLLRLRRWGWALVSGGCVLGAAANFWAFHGTHMGPYLVQGLFLMLFFLYMSRPEVRERLR